MRTQTAPPHLLSTKLSILVLASLGILLGAAKPSQSFDLNALEPGVDPKLQEDLTVNIVRIGFTGLIDPAEFEASLPSANWVARGAQGGGRLTEIEYRYDYNIVDAPPAFDDWFFSVLRVIAVPQPPLDLSPLFPSLSSPVPITPDQALYNYCNLDPSYDPSLGCDALAPSLARVNRRMIEENYLIDASFVEVLLSHNLPVLGVDVTSPTVVLINWWGRPDYVDHVYLNADEPTHETGVPRGLYVNNAVGGWGGTPVDDPQTCGRLPCVDHRLWFVDLSAGPFLNTDSWDLVSPDSRTRYSAFNEPGVVDYRLHHVADYELAGSGAYRQLDTLTRDLSEYLVGDVFLSLIATVSPIYPPDLSPPLLPEAIELDVNRYRWGDPRDLDGLLDLDHVASRLSKLPYTFTWELTEQDEPIDSRIGDAAFNLFGFGDYQPVFGGRLHPAADLYFYWRDHITEFLEGDSDYEIPVFQFALESFESVGLAGYAENNWSTAESNPNADGARLRQTLVVVTASPDEVPYFSQSTTLEHEVGHHLGLPHPFHGSRCVDAGCEQLKWFFGADSTAYSWQGLFVHGVMSYVHVNDDLSRFERDNVARWLAYQHLRYANQVATLLLDSPRADKVTGQVMAADAHAANALAAFQGMDYETAASEARAAFDILVSAASLIHIALEPPSATADLRTPPDHHQAMREYFRSLALDGPELNQGYRLDGLHPSISGLAGMNDVVLAQVSPVVPVSTFRYTPPVP